MTTPLHFPDLAYNAVLCRYDEIAIKGRNRSVFERKLVRALKRTFRGIGRLGVVREPGRIYLFPPEGRETFNAADYRLMRECTRHVFGLTSLSPGFLTAPDLAQIQHIVFETFPALYRAYEGAIQADRSIGYAMRVRRRNRLLGMTSTELEIYFADRLLPRYPRLQVNLNDPDLRVDVEIREQRAFVFYERMAGPGGLPSGTGGRLLALLSGGIDSPVACYQVMKRGCTLDFVTFHSAPYTPPGTVTKVAALVRVLKQWQWRGRLIAVNLLPAQRTIRDNCSERYRTLLYRRMMMRIASRLAGKVGAEALVTGEAIGQVASQTLPNLGVIAQAASLMILRPLLTFDKQETISIARFIGTLSISEENIPDSCTVFAPDSPATRADLDRIRAEENELALDELLDACIRQSTVVNPETFEERPLADALPA